MAHHSKEASTCFTVAVKTTDLFAAGTDANVFVELIGETGRRQFQLKHSINHRNKFERNHTDVFFFRKEKPIGAVKQVRIWHDNAHPGAGWHLAGVEVHDEKLSTAYYFPCERWLARDEDDGAVERTLACTRTRTKVPQHLRDPEKLNQHDAAATTAEEESEPKVGGQRTSTPSSAKVGATGPATMYYGNSHRTWSQQPWGKQI